MKTPFQAHPTPRTTPLIHVGLFAGLLSMYDVPLMVSVPMFCKVVDEFVMRDWYVRVREPLATPAVEIVLFDKSKLVEDIVIEPPSAPP